MKHILQTESIQKKRYGASPMNKKKKKKKEISWSSIRNDWGQVKPYTRIQEDNRKKKPKHKKKEEEVNEF